MALFTGVHNMNGFCLGKCICFVKSMWVNHPGFVVFVDGKDRDSLDLISNLAKPRCLQSASVCGCFWKCKGKGGSMFEGSGVF